MAYKLALSAGSQIHPVVHVSLLKQALPAAAVVQPDMPSQCAMVDTTLIPLQVLDTKTISCGKSSVQLVQVQWDGLPTSWSTWENKDRL